MVTARSSLVMFDSSMMLGVLASIYPILVGCELSRKYRSLAIFFSVFSARRVACRVCSSGCGWVVR